MNQKENLFQDNFNTIPLYKKLIYLIFIVGMVNFGDLIICSILPNLDKIYLTPIVYLLFFIVAIAIFGKTLFISTKNLKLKDFTPAFIIGFALVAGIVTSAIIIDSIGVQNNNENAINEDTETIPAIMFITAVFIAPVVEELLFRFTIFRGLYKFNPIMAHIVCALLFGLWHIDDYLIRGDFSQLLPGITYFIMGLGFSVSYDKTKNIMWPIFTHMSINFIASTG